MSMYVVWCVHRVHPRPLFLTARPPSNHALPEKTRPLCVSVIFVGQALIKQSPHTSLLVHYQKIQSRFSVRLHKALIRCAFTYAYS
jgi:hypothetical protein